MRTVEMIPAVIVGNPMQWSVIMSCEGRVADVDVEGNQDAGRTRAGSVRLSVMENISPEDAKLILDHINWPTEEELQEHDGEI